MEYEKFICLDFPSYSNSSQLAYILKYYQSMFFKIRQHQNNRILVTLMFYFLNDLFLREINLTFCFACAAMGP
jgi:hypothetical protein